MTLNKITILFEIRECCRVIRTNYYASWTKLGILLIRSLYSKPARCDVLSLCRFHRQMACGEHVSVECHCSHYKWDKQSRPKPRAERHASNVSQITSGHWVADEQRDISDSQMTWSCIVYDRMNHANIHPAISCVLPSRALPVIHTHRMSQHGLL